MRRISGRRICSECGANFNVEFIQPEEEGVCDHCGGELVQREDSKPEAVRKRLDVYHEETEPIVDFYEDRDVLVRINGEQPIQKVFDDIIEEITG